eukprot:974987-Amphidinium_carterae.1
MLKASLIPCTWRGKHQYALQHQARDTKWLKVCAVCNLQREYLTRKLLSFASALLQGRHGSHSSPAQAAELEKQKCWALPLHKVAVMLCNLATCGPLSSCCKLLKLLVNAKG